MHRARAHGEEGEMGYKRWGLTKYESKATTSHPCFAATY